MAKRKRNDGGEGRECYTVSVLDERLSRADQRLQQLCDQKIKLEDELKKTITGILCIDQRVHHLECKMENLMTHQTADVTNMKMKEELDHIKKDKEFMTCELKYYKKRVEDKLRKLKNCRTTHYD
ncbi:hypothetical protein Trydic_g23890 [Trypoxylus dichotomus]